jgi:hypothetical protein
MPAEPATLERFRALWDELDPLERAEVAAALGLGLLGLLADALEATGMTDTAAALRLLLPAPC